MNSSIRVVRAWLALPYEELQKRLLLESKYNTYLLNNLSEILTVLDANVETPNHPAHITFERLQVVAIEITACQADYGINEIPQATCAVSPGKRSDLYENSSPASLPVITVLEPFLPSLTKARIYVRCDRTDGDELLRDWPAEDLMLFDGLITGIGRSGSSSNYQVIITLRGWPVELTFSSMLSAHSMPENPFELAYQGLFRRTVAGDGTKGAPMWAPANSTAMASPDVIKTDMWGHFSGTNPNESYGLRKFLDGLASRDYFQWRSVNRAGVGVRCQETRAQIAASMGVGGTAANLQTGNFEAKTALARFEPFLGEVVPGLASWLAPGEAARVGQTAGKAPDRTLPGIAASLPPLGYEWGVPLAFGATAEQFSSLLAMGALKTFAYDMIFGSNESERDPIHVARSTFWDKIVAGYAGSFQTAVIPLSDRCLVVPFNPAYRHIWRWLSGYDITDVSLDTRIPRPLRGVVMISQAASLDGTILTQVAGPNGAIYNTLGVGGFYDSCRRGGFIFREAPNWLRSIVNPTFGPEASSPKSPAPAGLFLFGAQPDPAEQQDKITTLRTTSGTIADQFAKAAYQQEVLRNRHVNARGPLRLDVAPGSIVAIDIPDDKNVRPATPALGTATATDYEPSYLYGMVVRTSVSIDCENQDASTSFLIGFVRSEMENFDDEFTNSSHPIWAVNWRGAPLVPQVLPGGPTSKTDGERT